MIGERIRLAREARQLTQTQLASTASLSQNTISDLETGKIVNASFATIAAIAQATTYPVTFFYLGPLPDFPDGNFRRLKRGKAKVSAQIRAEVRQLAEVVQRAEGIIRLPAVRLEPTSVSHDLEDLEDLAIEVRGVLGVGVGDPIPNLTRAVERCGTTVVHLAADMEDHSGFSGWPDFGLEGRPIIALARFDPGDRNRWTLAHELGHLILHTARYKTEPDRAEKEANRFAGALLLPRKSAVIDVIGPITLRVLMGVKAKYGLSIAASAQRARDLGLISDDHFVSLRKQISARGWTKAEPVEVPSEHPLLIKKAMQAVGGGYGSLQERAERAGTPVFTFRALAS